MEKSITDGSDPLKISLHIITSCCSVVSELVRGCYAERAGFKPRYGKNILKRRKYVCFL